MLRNKFLVRGVLPPPIQAALLASIKPVDVSDNILIGIELLVPDDTIYDICIQAVSTISASLPSSAASST